MRTTTVLIASASLFSSVTAHSWLECTDYRITQGSADSKVWNKALCFGRARCGKRQDDAGFGVDTGFNFHSSSGCQCARGSDNYDGITKATYTPGQRVCVAYPPKNHVAAPCTNEYIPDSGTVITRTAVNPTSDSTPFVKKYENTNGKHQSGTVDYKGFQSCPNFCADKEKSLCTMCFDLEHDIAPGEYSFKWMWSFNSKEDTYSTCWEAKVIAGNGESSVIPLPAPVPDGTTSPTVAPVTTSPSVVPGPRPTEPAYVGEGGDDIECEDGPDVPVNYNPVEEAEEDCDDPLPQPEDGEDCDDPLPQPEDDEDCDEPLPLAGDQQSNDAYNTPTQQPAPAPATIAPTPAPAPESAAVTTQKPEAATANVEDLCGVEEDEPTQEGPGSVQPYPVRK